jgi:hypothetical protein
MKRTAMHTALMRNGQETGKCEIVETRAERFRSGLSLDEK